MLSKKEIEEIKEQLLKQLDKFPEDKREQIRNTILQMSDKEIETFVKQNQLTHLGSQCIFCSIIKKEIESFPIGEDNQAIAILEINPLSRGHTLIIPKDHEADIGNATQRLSKIVTQKIASALRPKEIQTKKTQIMGHPILEVVPIFGEETKRRKASKEELEKIKELITKPHQKKDKKPEKKTIPKFKPRIP